jgi:acetyl esterase/lipase
MKKLFFLIFLLIFFIKGDHKYEIRPINLASFSGNITLDLKHGIWREWQGKIYYQTLVINLICQLGECQPEVFAYAPRFDDKKEYLGKLKSIKIDNAWYLKIGINLEKFFPDNPLASGDYNIQLVPYQKGYFGEYSGKLNNHYLQGKIETTIKPFPQLISNYKDNSYHKTSKFVLTQDNLRLNNYKVYRNINYLTINDHQLLLDIYERKTEQPTPTLIYIHGGGWTQGNKPSINAFWRYLMMGFSVVNIQYRLGGIAPAPAAVEDSLCALYWVNKNAQKYNFDPNKIVVTGVSAGGHLALMTGMVSSPNVLIKNCPFAVDNSPKVAAIVNWFGPTDVSELLIGENPKDYAIKWLNGASNKTEIAKLVSPINYVNKNLPPVLSIHGSEDIIVPYSQAVKLHENLTKMGVLNGLLRLPGRKHGDFSQAEIRQIYNNIEDFLTQNKILD